MQFEIMYMAQRHDSALRLFLFKKIYILTKAHKMKKQT